VRKKAWSRSIQILGEARPVAGKSRANPAGERLPESLIKMTSLNIAKEKKKKVSGGGEANVVQHECYV